MRILQIFPHNYSENIRWGGLLMYVRSISERLAKNHDVTVYATDSGNFSSFEVINGVKVYRFSRIAPHYSYFFSLGMILKIRKSDFDVIHGHCYQSFPVHFSTLAKRKKFIFSSHFHGVGHSPFRNSLLKVGKRVGEKTLKTADRVIAVSNFEKNLLCKRFNVNPNKVTVIPCGVNFSEFRSLKRNNHNGRSILFVGRLEGYKGAQHLIGALSMLDDDFKLEIVGNGEMKSLMQSQMLKLNLQDRVAFYDNILRQDLLQKFVDADVFVLPSMYEAYSMVVAEAITAGTPCIVADTSALSEWIDNKSCFGIKLPINLKTLSSMIEEVSTLKKSNYNMYPYNEKIRDWNSVVKQLECIYEN